MLWLLLACSEDPCVAMCVAAQARYEVCMEERGLTYGMTYADAADYQNACDTWVWEQRQLGEEPACVDMTTTFDEGTCEEYDAAW
jgi:hypothetical protein